MVHYGFYADQYLGSLIPEQAFTEAAARARDALDRMKGLYRVEAPDAQAEAMALCAMAEAVYIASKGAGLTSATVGNVSVRYGEDRNMDRELYKKAAIYLNIYRGVG